MSKVLIVLFIISIFSCKNSQDSEIIFMEESPKGVIHDDTLILLDTAVILSNSNLEKFILLIEKEEIVEDSTTDKIPKQSINFIKKVTGLNSFILANPNEGWAAGCMQEFGVPNKKLVYLGYSENITILIYLKGGIGVIGHILLFEHKNGEVVDFWSGTGHNIKNKKDLIKYLKARKGLNSNFIYL